MSGRGVCPEVNKFGEVSNDGHQISVAGEQGALYSEVQCIMGNGHMGIRPHCTDRLPDTHTTENITMPHLRWWAIMKGFFNGFQAILISMCLQGMVDELMMKKQGGRMKRVRTLRESVRHA